MLNISKELEQKFEIKKGRRCQPYFLVLLLEDVRGDVINTHVF